jgi:hypothetical protein
MEVSIMFSFNTTSIIILNVTTRNLIGIRRRFAGTFILSTNQLATRFCVYSLVHFSTLKMKEVFTALRTLHPTRYYSSDYLDGSRKLEHVSGQPYSTSFSGNVVAGILSTL